jgi:hypothetical protein
MNRRLWETVVCGAVATFIASPLAFAQSDTQASTAARGSDRPNQRVAQTRIAADAGTVRLAGLIRNDGAVLRNKGIASVTKPARGVFCIKPTAASGITPSNAIVQLTVDWSRTQFNEALAQWADIPQRCHASQIEVRTLLDTQPNGFFTQSDAVSFSIIVP